MGKLSIVVFLACCMLCGLLAGCPVNADTTPPSIISSDTTWTQAGSPYTLSGPTLIQAGVTLTIEAGATVNLGTYYLQVNGTLIAKGTSSNQVHINGASVNAGAIRFTASSGADCIIQNAIISQTVISTVNCSVKIDNNTFNDAADMQHENVAVTTRGIGSSTISNNNFVACGLEISDSSTVSNNIIQGGIGLNDGSPLVSENTISGGSSYFWIGRSFDRDYSTLVIYCSARVSGNTINGGTIISCYDSISPVIDGNIMMGPIGDGEYVSGSTTFDVDISDNKIAGDIAFDMANVTVNHNLIVNADTGVQVGNGEVTDNTIAYCSTGVKVNSGCAPPIHGNNIVNCSQHSLQLTGSGNVDATNNWWGTTDQSAISSSIYDSKNDFNLGTVTFVPFLSAFNTNAPALDLSFVSPTSAPSTPTPTTSPTSPSMPTESPTQQPTVPPNNIIVNPVTVVIAVMAVIIVVLLVFVVILSRRLNANHSSNFQNPPAPAAAFPWSRVGR